MGIPDYQTIMLPLLEFYKDKKDHHIREAIEHISDVFSLSEEERKKLLPSGQQPYIDNRVGWSRTHLKKAGLLESKQRGYANITQRGLDVLKSNPDKIDNNFLEQFPDFVEFWKGSKERAVIKKKFIRGEKIEDQTPDELMLEGYNIINESLAQELLYKLREEHFSVLENIVLKLLINMGYGEGKVTGKSGDGGVDGFIDQDKLGLDKIYFQAKRYDENNSVTSSQLRDFIGALELKGVTKGVFITTSKFPTNAEDVVSRTTKSIILIDGIKLAKLMIEYDIGVTTEKEYKIKRIDTDFFEME